MAQCIGGQDYSYVSVVNNLVIACVVFCLIKTQGALCYFEGILQVSGSMPGYFNKQSSLYVVAHRHTM